MEIKLNEVLFYKKIYRKRKFLMIMMRNVLILSCITLFNFTTIAGFSQNEKITIKADQTLTLVEVFELIKEQTGYTFMHKSDLFDGAPPVSLQKGVITVKKLLDKSLENSDFTYEFTKDGSIILKPIPEPIKITGKVTDSEGKPLPNATVIIKGTNTGVTADMKGNYTITVPDFKTTLVFSYVGFATQEIVVGNKVTINVSLEQAATELEGVTINAGYYTVKEREKTGNISRVSAKEIEQQPISNPLQAIQGRMPGVYITQKSGVPGGGFDIRIRGINSIRYLFDDSDDPLYLVNGVPFPSLNLNTGYSFSAKGKGNSLSTINPDDIESIEILKDADATAIYGSRGANGVVLITTKKGQAGKTKLDIDIAQGMGAIPRKIELMNTEQYVEMRREGIENSGYGGLPIETLRRVLPDAYVWGTDRYTDWQEVLLGGTAHQTNANMALSGGNSTTNFMIGGSYYREKTVFPGDGDFQRAAVRLNLNHASKNRKLNVSLSVNYTTSKSTRFPGTDFTRKALTLAPNAPDLYDEEGNINWENSTWHNPLSDLEKEFNDQTDNLVANTQISYRILPGLQIKTTLGYNTIHLDEVAIIPFSSIDPGRLTPNSIAYSDFGKRNIKSWNIEPQLEYSRKIAKGELKLLLGNTFQNTVSEAQAIRAQGFSSDALLLNIKSATDLRIRYSDYSEYRHYAIYGRMNYTWDKKYIVNLTGRRDGSSRFGPGKQFGYFGAFGLAWIFSKEQFIQDAFPFISFGKLRASYGSTGNDQIGNYEYLNTFSSVDDPYNGSKGLLVTRHANPDYSWETVKKLEVGLEMGLFEDKIFTTVSWYRNRATDQLVGFPLSQVTGKSSVQFNLPATVENRGWEFELSAKIFNTDHFQWNTAFNLTIPQNELIEFPDIELFPTYDFRWEIGKSIFGQKMYEYKGINPETGLYEFVDYDGDGNISYNDYQKYVEIGQTYYGGLHNSLSYKGFQFDFFFQFVKQTGQDFFTVFTLPGSGGHSRHSAAPNQPAAVLDRWQQPGDMASFQQYAFSSFGDASRAFSKFKQSNAAYRDNSFIRLKNISLSYTFPERILSKLGLQRLRVYIEGQNVLTITDYEGFDPEYSLGLPPLRMFTAGLQITL